MSVANKSRLLRKSSTSLPPSAAEPPIASVSVPAPVMSTSSVLKASSEKAPPMVRLRVASTSVPPASETFPLPSALEDAATSRPPLTVVPPEKTVIAGERELSGFPAWSASPSPRCRC